MPGCALPLSRTWTPQCRVWGRAKGVVLDLDEAVAVARPAGLHLECLTGDHGGMIGALPTSSKVQELRQFGPLR